MSVANYLTGRSVVGQVLGKDDETFVLSRVGRGSSQFQLNNVSKVLFQRDTAVVEGDVLVISDEHYFVVAGRTSATGASMGQLYKSNATVDISRIQKHMTGIVHDYDEAIPLYSNQVTMYEDINGKMQLYDAGLLATSTKRFLLPKLDIEKLDRITLNGEPMQIDVINTSKFPGFLSVQCSPDKRKVK